MNVELIGRAAHVIRNEEPGVSILLTAVEIIHQIPVGRLNDNLSINVFDLVSLSPSNAVPKYARFDAVRCKATPSRRSGMDHQGGGDG